MTATKCVLHITIIDMSVCCNDTDKKNKLVLFLELLSYVYTAVVDQVGDQILTVNFKIVTLVHRSLSGHIPSYLADDCRLVTDARPRRLRSADTRTLAVGRTQSTFGDRTFAAAASRLWNSLPPELQQPELSYGQFRRSLKTFLFGQ